MLHQHRRWWGHGACAGRVAGSPGHPPATRAPGPALLDALPVSPPNISGEEKTPAHTCLSLFSEISESFCLKFPPSPSKSQSKLAAWEKHNHSLIHSGKQGHFREALTMCNTASLDYVRNQIPIPSSTRPQRPAVSQPHRAGGPGLGPPSASCSIRASQRGRLAPPASEP